MQSEVQYILSPTLEKSQISLAVKREDLLHPVISGNKYRKLKYNLAEAKKLEYDTLLTFGGAYSNHILATAGAAKEHGFSCVGVIRGEELKDRWQSNPTLLKAAELGMRFHFISREQYREKDSVIFLRKLYKKFGQPYILPEGGTNDLAVKGCEEILTDSDIEFDYICCPVGTGGTLSGLIKASHPHQKVLGFPALDVEYVIDNIKGYVSTSNWHLFKDYDFGGYAKIDEDLVQFINSFKEEHDVSFDPIYTGKMMYGIWDLIKNGYFRPDSKILVIHTGGLQGIQGMNIVLKAKNLPLLKV